MVVAVFIERSEREVMKVVINSLNILINKGERASQKKIKPSGPGALLLDILLRVYNCSPGVYGFI